jgi:hypothetical protein
MKRIALLPALSIAVLAQPYDQQRQNLINQDRSHDVWLIIIVGALAIGLGYLLGRKKP